MPKQIIKRFTPDRETLKNHRHLRVFGHLLQDPNLWHLNRRSVSGAFAVGLFWAMIPIPMQMVAAAFNAILVRVNLPISVALVWLTNPLTMPAVFYFNYLVGTWIIGPNPDVGEFQLSLEWISQELERIWEPLYLGSLVVGIVSALLGYAGMRLYWRWHTVCQLRRRRARRNVARPHSQDR